MIYTPEDQASMGEAFGVLTIQYSPYDHDGGSDGGRPQARVRVFAEARQEAVIDKSWDSPFASGTAGGQGGK